MQLATSLCIVRQRELGCRALVHTHVHDGPHWTYKMPIESQNDVMIVV